MMDVRSRTIEDPDGEFEIRFSILVRMKSDIMHSKPRQDGQDLDFDVEGTILVAPLAIHYYPANKLY